ncbi:MAG: hypothetical protein K2Q22_04465, partial [Cytophagales bacterium]|nr:hypothetical protein [Cytophagales bacterium]
MTRTNAVTGSSGGGNIYKGQLDILDNTYSTPSNGGIKFGTNYRDIFNGKVNLKNFSNGTIYFGYSNNSNTTLIGNLFSDDINIYYPISGGGINFNSGFLGITSLIGVSSNIYLVKNNPNDRNLGTITINKLYKESSLPMNWGDANDGSFTLNDVYINGDLNLKSTYTALIDGTYTGICNFDISGTVGMNWNCSKNTIFNNDVNLKYNSPNNLNSSNGSGRFIFKGNLNVIRNGNGIVGIGNSDFYKNFTYLSNSTLTSSTLSLDGIESFIGSNDQYINLTYGLGTNTGVASSFGPIPVSKMLINKPSGNVITNTTLAINGSGYLNLLNGKLIAQTGTNLGVYLTGNSSILGGNFNSFIDGQVAAYQSIPLSFQVGRGQNYMPLYVSAASSQVSYIAVKPIVTP